MRIPGDRVGALDTRELVAQFVRQEAAASPGGVYVEPHIVLGTDIGDLVNRIEGAKHGGAAGAVDIEGPLAHLDAFHNQPLELVGPHSAALVARHLDHVVGAQSAGGAGALARVVALLGRYSIRVSRASALIGFGRVGWRKYSRAPR